MCLYWLYFFFVLDFTLCSNLKIVICPNFGTDKERCSLSIDKERCSLSTDKQRHPKIITRKNQCIKKSQADKLKKKAV